MQSAEDRFGTDRIRVSPAMAWAGTWKDEAAGRGIGNAGTQCHMWASAIVVLDPKSQGTPQMGFRERNEPVQTLATYRPDHPFAEAVRHWTARRRFQNTQPQAADSGVESPREKRLSRSCSR